MRIERIHGQINMETKTNVVLVHGAWADGSSWGNRSYLGRRIVLNMETMRCDRPPLCLLRAQRMSFAASKTQDFIESYSAFRKRTAAQERRVAALILCCRIAGTQASEAGPTLAE